MLIAEGVGSTTRELLFAGENHPRWMDVTIAYFTIPRGDSDGTEARWYNAPDGRVILLRPDPHGGTRAVLMVREEVRAARELSDEEAKSWLAERFADAGWEAQRVIAGILKTGLACFNKLAVGPLTRIRASIRPSSTCPE